MIAFLKLVRLPNLVMIALTQYMVRYCIILPVVNLSGLELQMQEWEFALLVLSTVLIAAGGYIINDYFDVRIDRINKPEQQVIDIEIKRRVAIAAHAGFSTAGAVVGIFLSWKSNILVAGSSIFILSVIGLWFYSTTFKYQLLTGNLLVSLLTGMVPFLPSLFEVPRLATAYHTEFYIQKMQFGSVVTSGKIILWSGLFSVFAFLLSFIREIIKDMEDIEGDSEYDCKTLPIVFGIKKTKMFVSAIIFLTLAGCAYCQFFLHKLLHNLYADLYFFLLVNLPLAALVVLLWKVTDSIAPDTIRKKEKKHFHHASILVKLIMLSGICYLFLFRYFFPG